MIIDGKRLTPATKETAGPDNYTWWNGEGTEPQRFGSGVRAGYVFFSKEEIAEQIYQDYPDGLPLKIVGQPAFVGEGTVIGGPGFGWYGNPPKRFPQVGGIHFGVDVEVGANTTIDRGSLGNTIIGHNVKIDNGVHVGHNVNIGHRSILTAHCCIGGSAVIGNDCWIGLGAQIRNKVVIGDGAIIGMGAIVVKDVAPGVTVVGNPARILE